MRSAQAKAIIKDCIDRGWLEHNGTYYPPQSAEAKRLQAETAHSTKKRKRGLKPLKTGWTDDSRNIKNKATHTDQFTKLIEIELNTQCWPEFHFATDRKWRFDYCLPEFKLAIESEGGIYSGGRHTRGKGYENDLEKYNRATADGWILIRVTPSQLLTSETIELIKKAIDNKQ
jgi:very-short-patch-repair endonuclease